MLKKVIGDRSAATMNRTYAGSCTWLNGVFWIESVKTDWHRTVIRNLGDVGKTKVDSIAVALENDFIFPLLRGRDVHAWHAEPSAMIVVPHRREDFSQPVGFAELKRENPLTFEFFKKFERQLKSRSGYKQLHKERKEFYVVGNLGKYTLAPYKVVFKELTEIFQCAVVGPSANKIADDRPIIPDHKLLFMACERADEAYFLAGILNSIPARSALYSASVGVQTQSYYPTDVSRIRLPEFSQGDEGHREVVRISKACHESATGGGVSLVPSDAEMELTAAVSAMWNISRKELKHIVDYYGEIQTLRSRGRATAEDESEGDL